MAGWEGTGRRARRCLCTSVPWRSWAPSRSRRATGDDAAPADVVGSADAITAAVAWQADEQEPVLDDKGEPLLPVIFVVAGDGTTIDVGVQADVAGATVDWATVRFADRAADAFDPDVEGEPVRDDGVMLLVGPIPEPARTIELDVVRYIALDEGQPLTLEIVSEPSPTDTSDDPSTAGHRHVGDTALSIESASSSARSASLSLTS